MHHEKYATPWRHATLTSERRPPSTDTSDLDADGVVSASRSDYQNEPPHAQWLAYLSRHVSLGGFLCGGSGSRQVHSQKAGPLSGAEREQYFRRQKEWLEWLAAELRSDNGQALARGVDVAAQTALALATVISKSGPSFSQQGIYSKQDTLAAKLAKQLVRAKADVRLVRRATKLLVKIGLSASRPEVGLLICSYRCWQGDRLDETVETKTEGGTTASAHPGRQRPLNPGRHRPRTPDASVLQVFL